MRVVPLNALCVVACPESDAAYSSYFFSTGSAIPAPCDTYYDSRSLCGLATLPDLLFTLDLESRSRARPGGGTLKQSTQLRPFGHGKGAAPNDD